MVRKGESRRGKRAAILLKLFLFRTFAPTYFFLTIDKKMFIIINNIKLYNVHINLTKDIYQI